MYGSLFVPEKSSRHRASVLALFRALLRATRHAPLDNSHKTLLRSQIRRQIDGNRKQASLRLTYVALSAGYNYLSLLTNSRDTPSPAHKTLIGLVAEISQSVPPSTKGTNPHLAPATAPSSQDRVPSSPQKPHKQKRRPARAHAAIIRNVLIRRNSPPNTPDAPPTYIPARNPKPLSKDPTSRQIRRIPRLCLTSSGIPFLRTTRHQPRHLAIGLRDETRLRIRLRESLLHLEDHALEEARSEDLWEAMVHKLLTEGEKADLASVVATEGSLDPGLVGLDSYTRFVDDAALLIDRKIERLFQDDIARSDALLKIVQSETALAARERMMTDRVAGDRPPGASACSSTRAYASGGVVARSRGIHVKRKPTKKERVAQARSEGSGAKVRRFVVGSAYPYPPVVQFVGDQPLSL